MTPVLFQAIYTGWVIFFAYMNKLWIAKNYPFRHWANAIAHLSAAGFAGFHFGWQYGVAVLFLVRVVFDGTLSLFRGLSFDYVSPKPASTVDRLEKRVFGRNGLLPKLLYLVIVILLNLPIW